MLLSRLDSRTANLIRLAGLALVSWSVVNADKYTPSGHGRGLVVAIAFALCLLSALAWIARPMGGRGLTPEVWLMAAAGGFLTGAASHSAASVFPFVAVVTAGVRSEVAPGGLIVAVAVLGLGIAALLYDNGALGVLAFTLGFVAALLGASNTRQSVDRAEQAELLLAQTQRSHEEQLRSARLEESTRIAREIHDVLAHALAGLTIQLEATSTLIDQGADAATIKPRVDRALELARQGLHETRRAVGALRGDAVAQPATGEAAATIRALAAEYRDAFPAAAVEVVVGAGLASLAGERAATVVRVVQEALTNVRKHAPGADVAVSAGASERGIELVIEDRGGGPAAAGGLASSGGGYGVRGMRERAERLGGTLEAGRTGDGWRVALLLPLDPAGGSEQL